VVVGNLKDATAAWYPHYLADGNVINNLREFEQALMDAFVPEDYQAILRRGQKP